MKTSLERDDFCMGAHSFSMSLYVLPNDGGHHSYTSAFPSSNSNIHPIGSRAGSIRIWGVGFSVSAAQAGFMVEVEVYEVEQEKKVREQQSVASYLSAKSKAPAHFYPDFHWLWSFVLINKV